ncbi:MAG: DUF423 domain-containing protein [Flavobacteriia bacterium]|jgi:uncharacterized membrane protein YgdD (TMEM256/DUF423 family)
MNLKATITASIIVVTSIMLGAFGAHAIKELVTAERLATFEVGVRYQMYIGLSMLLLALSEDRIPFEMRLVRMLMFIGVLLFSGSIYLIALSDLYGLSTKILGPLTPIGGLCLMLGWAVFIYRVWKVAKKS